MVNGQLLYVFVLNIVVTMAVSVVAVWHYGRCVLAGMRGLAGGVIAVPERVLVARARSAGALSAQALLAWEQRFEGRVIATWFVSFALAAVPLAVVDLAASGVLDRLSQVVALAAVLCNLAIPVVAVARGWGGRRTFVFALKAVLAGAAVTTLAPVLVRLAHGRLPSLDLAYNALLYFQLAAVTLALPGAMLLLSMPRRIRQVVPLVFGTLALFTLAPFLGMQAFTALASTARGTSLVFTAGFDLTREAVFAALAVPAGWLVAKRLNALARGHVAKRFSDVQLQARAWWLMLVFDLGIGLVSRDDVAWWGAPGCALAGLAFVPLNAWVFRRWPPAAEALPARELLFLRAFGWRARTERLFDRIGARWRGLGPITMIAAPDVVARSIDSVDLLAYLQGREGDAFVQDAADLAARVAGVDVERDPDGRFRIVEFCCRDDTWQATAVALMDRADVVLMDLRGVKDARTGCAFELDQLAARLPPERVVLVVDDDTALEPVRAALGAAADRFTLHRMAGDDAAAHDALFRRLAQACV